ncbi:hypothetical protein NDI56_03000 [Haloarcula sp. S1CR25-12]|uniref:Uncharacterized protein n=1 Tax=Haloarcula saliterrae TaxID=2950534 RepID=A0ABU2F991_9EURY|nr:hypothetical protein [Haloarcula sp. S1CR25-12]MDS0258376.1 hypothetical protein [Haloarcula sp. S1CR25-12]
MSNQIELRNENGEIIALDSEGNKIPVKFEDGKFDSVNTGKQVIGGDIYLGGGGNLREKVLSALENGASRIFVAEPIDNQWTWDSQLTIDPNVHEGFELRIAERAEIECSATGWALSIDESNSVDGANASRWTTTIMGGSWHSTESSNNGWLQLKDTTDVHIGPRTVRDFTVGISVENHELFCENTQITRGEYRVTDIGIQFLPASVTGGSGTPSFVDTEISPESVKYGNIGMRLQGDLGNAVIMQPAMFPTGNNSVAFELSGLLENAVMTAPRIDDPLNNYTGTVAFKTTADYSNSGPLVQQYRLNNIDTLVELNDVDADRIQFDSVSGPYRQLGDLGKDYVSIKDGNIRTYDEKGTVGFRVNSKGQIFDILNFDTGSSVQFASGLKSTGGGTYDNGVIEMGSNGARLEVNDSGEIVVVDESGDETVLS